MVSIKDIPTLTGQAADRFIKMSEDNYNHRQTIDFSKEFNNSMEILKKRKKSLD